MGLPPITEFSGVVVTFAGIVRHNAAYPSPPNGNWFIPRVPDVYPWLITFFKLFPTWMIYFDLQNIDQVTWSANLQARIGSAGEMAFYGLNGYWEASDPFAFENQIEWPDPVYSGGKGMVVAVSATGVPNNVRDIAAILNFPIEKGLFTEQITAPGLHRAIRFARRSDGTCVHIVPTDIM